MSTTTGTIMPLDEVLSRVRRFMWIEDETPILAALGAAVVAGAQEGPPCWLMVVGQASGGKSSIIGLLAEVADETIDDLSAAGLLSWTRSGKNAKETGLLPRIGPHPALVIVSDYSTLLGSDRHADARASTFALLRRVYDGEVERDLGQAERKLTWRGKATLIAAATTAIDRFSSHTSALGERWIYVRVHELSPEGERQAKFLTRHVARDKKALRKDAAWAARTAVEDARQRLVDDPPVLTDRILDVIDEAAAVTAAGRASVPRESYGRRDICGEVEREAPMRIVDQLTAMYAGLRALGLELPDALRVVSRCAVDSIPGVRAKVLREMVHGERLTSSDIARRVGVSRTPIRTTLEDLAAIGFLRFEGDDDDVDEEDHATTAPKPYWIAGPDGEAAQRILRREAVLDAKCGSLPHKTESATTPHFAPSGSVETNGHRVPEDAR